jgi:hypothetical protein
MDLANVTLSLAAASEVQFGRHLRIAERQLTRSSPAALMRVNQLINLYLTYCTTVGTTEN